jgi:Transcriptional Coactivator p15 (PC4)
VNGPDHIGGPVWRYRKSRAILLAGERTFKGKRFFEVREWLDSDPMTATGKGVTIPLDALESFHEAIGDYLISRRQ